LMTAAEKAEIPTKLYDFFAFGPDHKLGILPVGFVDFGFNPSVGLYAFWFDAFNIKNNNLHTHYEAWPDDWIAGSMTDRIQLDPDRALTFRVSGVRRPDEVFFGIGPSTPQSNRSRFGSHRFDARTTFDARVWRSSTIETAIGIRKVDVGPGHYGNDVSIENGNFPTPFGFQRGYTSPYVRALAAFDTRRKGGLGSGVRAEVDGEQGVDVERSPSFGWFRWGAVASGIVDLGDHGRVLTLKVGFYFVEPLGNGPIPFTELVTLGGHEWMPGHFPGRLVDHSAAVSSLQYTWPIAPLLSATLKAGVGNVFGDHLAGFRPELLRLSGAAGLAITSNPPIELLVGFGTDTFERGATVDSFRFSFGVPRLF